MLGSITNTPSGVISLVWLRLISSTVPEVESASIKSPMEKGWEERITRPPATFPRISSAARVMPRDPTDSSATREVMSISRHSAVMMPATM